MKLCIFIGVNVGGDAGEVLGEPIDLMTAFLVCGLGSLSSVCVGGV